MTDTGIEVSYRTQNPISTQIPLLVDPNTRFTPGWAEKYVGQNTPGGVAWGLVNGPMVSVHIVPAGEAQDQVKMRAFSESLSLLSSPENADFDYPPGHYVPFPMAIVELEISGNYSLFIKLK